MTRPSRRTERNGSTIAISRSSASAVTACGAGLQRGGGAGVVEADPREHLAAVEAEGRDLGGACRPVKRSSSSNAAPCNPPRFIEPMTTLSSSAPISRRSSRMSGVPSTPSTPGRATAVASRSSRSLRLAMAIPSARTPRAPRAGWSAATMRRRPSVPTSGRRWRAAQADAMRPGSRARTSVRSATDSGVSVVSERRGHQQPPARDGPARRARSRTSASSGMAVEHSSREATMAPATLANSRIRRRSQPPSRPWTSAPPNASPAPSPLTTVDRERRHLDPLVAGGGEHPLGALLDDRELEPPVEQGVGGAVAGRSRRRRPRTPRGCRRRWSRARAPSRPARGRRRRRARTSAASRGRGRCACAGRAPPRRRSARRGWAPGTGRSPWTSRSWRPGSPAAEGCPAR